MRRQARGEMRTHANTAGGQRRTGASTSDAQAAAACSGKTASTSGARRSAAATAGGSAAPHAQTRPTQLAPSASAALALGAASLATSGDASVRRRTWRGGTRGGSATRSTSGALRESCDESASSSAARDIRRSSLPTALLTASLSSLIVRSEVLRFAHRIDIPFCFCFSFFGQTAARIHDGSTQEESTRVMCFPCRSHSSASNSKAAAPDALVGATAKYRSTTELRTARPVFALELDLANVRVRNVAIVRASLACDRLTVAHRRWRSIAASRRFCRPSFRTRICSLSRRRARFSTTRSLGAHARTHGGGGGGARLADR